MLRIHTFGRLHVRGTTGIVAGAAAQPRRLAILALLAAAGEQGLTREKVLALIWPDAEEERARRGLNQALYALRQDLGADEVFLGSRDVRLNADLITSDLHDFRQALAEGKLTDAASLYTGPFLDAFHLPGAVEFERWVEEERADLARSYAQSLERLARRAEERGQWVEAVGWWRKVAAQDPLNARIALQLMRALAQSGDRAAALQHAHVYQVLHEQELDAPADAEVLAYAAELKQSATARAAEAPAARAPAEPAVPSVGPAGAVGAPTPPIAPVPAPVSPADVPAPASAVSAVPAPPSTPRTTRRVRSHAALVIGLAGLTAVGVVAGLRRGHDAIAELLPGSAHRVAFDDALELQPSLSPDGKLIAYMADQGDHFELFVRQVNAGHAVPISAGLPGSKWHPRWSPDGAQIAFQSERSIYLVPAFGGAPTVLVRPSRPDGWVAGPAWSPDGARIAYVEDWGIHTRAVSGDGDRLIEDSVPAHSLAWSPDGRWIAFVSGNPAFESGELPWGSATNLGNIAPSGVWVVPSSGGAPVSVTGAAALNTSPVWLPDSRGLLFVSNRDGSRDVYRVEIGGDGKALAGPTRLTTGLNAHTISLSGDAHRLAYSVFTYASNIWSAEIPDTGTVALSGARPLTQGSQVIEGISLSPDGRWLAFDSDREGNQDVYKVPLTGGDPTPVTRSTDDEFVSGWSADGRQLALHAYVGGVRRVRLVSADGGEPQEILRDPPNQRSPALSPDGRRLVFTSDVAGRYQLFLTVRRSDGTWGSARQLTKEGGWAGRWAPDGHSMVYCRADGVWVLAPMSGVTRPLVRLASADSARAGPVRAGRADGLLQGVRRARALDDLGSGGGGRRGSPRAPIRPRPPVLAAGVRHRRPPAVLHHRRARERRLGHAAGQALSRTDLLSPDHPHRTTPRNRFIRPNFPRVIPE